MCKQTHALIMITTTPGLNNTLAQTCIVYYIQRHSYLNAAQYRHLDSLVV